jgi:DHA3 family macrolide efflux protein-like MFS transporter
VRFALIWWLTASTGSAVVLATATTITLLPTIFIGPFAGALVDRWPCKWVLIVSDGAIATFTGLLAILFWLGATQTWYVFAVLFVRSLGDAFHTPAMMSTTPMMVPKEQLTRVSGMNSTLEGIIRFAAPGLGALLVELIGVRGVLPIDVATALLAILPLFFIPVPQPAVKAGVRGPRVVLQDLGEGLRYIWGWRGLRYLVASSILMGLAAQPMISFLPLLISQHFHGGALQLGWLQSTGGLCMIVGGAFLSAWGGLKRHMATSLIGTSGFCLGALLLALAPGNALWLAIAGWGIVGLSGPIHNGGGRAALQSTIAPGMLGRYFAVTSSVMTALTPLELAIAAPLANVWGVRPFYFIAFALLVAIVLIRRFTREIYHLEDSPQRHLAGVADSPEANVAAA